MKKHFYTDIIEIDSVYTAIDLLDLQNHERDELILIIESHVYHVVIDTVLSELTEEDKRIFLSHVSAERHEHVWTVLNKKMKDPAKKIRQAVDKLKRELHEDIQKVKGKGK